MIKTLKPYGAISEKEIQFLKIIKDKPCIVDKQANQIVISLEDFDKLKTKFTVKED